MNKDLKEPLGFEVSPSISDLDETQPAALPAVVRVCHAAVVLLEVLDYEID